MLPWSFSEEGAAEKYMPQLQHNMWVTNATTAVLSVITGGGKWVEISIVADSLYQLLPDPSSGISTLTLHLAADRRITAIDVAYGPERRYADEVAQARGRLGNPSGTHTDDDGSQYTVWQDARTRFELVGRVFNNRSTVTGRLTDLLLAQ